MPCLATCCIGPRVGLEMNDGGRVSSLEVLTLVGDGVILPMLGLPLPLFQSVMVGQAGLGSSMDSADMGKPIEVQGEFKKGGCTPFLASCCIGPRVGYELNDGRQVRNIEWLSMIVPVIPRLYMMYEAFDGKTMSEVATAERLDS